MKRKDFLKKTMLLALGPVIGPVNSTVYANPFEERDIPIKGRWLMAIAEIPCSLSGIIQKSLLLLLTPLFILREQAVILT